MTQIRYNDLDQTLSFRRLSEIQVPSLKKILTEERIGTCSINAGGGIQYNYAALPVDDELISLLADLAEEQQLITKYEAVLQGNRMNTGEGRMVLHHLTRGECGWTVEEEGQNKRSFYMEQFERIADFSHRVHTGKITGSGGAMFTDVVQIGIGGSDLGPRALYLAMAGAYAGKGSDRKELSPPFLRARFISNVDPDDAASVLKEIPLESTLFILVSKSGTTQETLTNRQLVINYIREHAPEIDPSRHMIAVTSQTSPLADSDDFLESFYIDDYIGGRYSSTSAVGIALLSLCFGYEECVKLLKGAHEADLLAREPVVTENASLLDALIGVFLGNVLGYRMSTVLPYSQALVRFPAHLQQLDMESNGKQVNRFGAPVAYHTGPVIFGEPGTNGQHSFYQLLHQGTEKVSLQFIGFRNNQQDIDLETEGFSSRQKLNANLAAQIVAFARGREDTNLSKNFPGRRPSSLLHAETLTPESLGALLAHFENKVMFQGFLWNINSFDQEGVQLGKVLAKQILSGTPADTLLTAYARILGV